MSADVTAAQTGTVLIETLLVAVPMWVNNLRHCSHEELKERATRCADEIAAHGDIIMFRGKTAEHRKGTAQGFNALAEGIAIGAHAPGGITFSGYHWCVGSAHWGIPQDHTGPCDEELARAAA